MFGWGRKEKAQGGAAVAEKASPAPAKADVAFKVKERQGCLVRFAVEVSAERVGRSLEESFLRIQSRVRWPGFRAGRAPLDIVKKNYAGAAWEDAVDELLKEAVREAVNRETVVPVGPPVVEKVDGRAGTPLRFEVKIECAPTVALKDYRGLSLARKARPVNDEEVAKAIDELREAHARLVPCIDEAAGPQHFVVVDYESFVEGVPLPEGKATAQLIEMSAPQNVQGFTEGLLGARVGDTRDIAVGFPQEHPNKALAGKTAQFRVHVTAIKAKQVPAADAEFAKDVGAGDLEDLRARVRRNIESARKRAERQDLEKQVIEELLKRHPFEVPASQVEERARRLTEEMKRHLLKRGASESDWASQEEALRTRNRPEAERQVRLSYILAHLVEAESIAVPDEQVEARVRLMLDGMAANSRADAERWLIERRESLRDQLREERLFDFLIENARITDVPAA